MARKRGKSKYKDFSLPVKVLALGGVTAASYMEMFGAAGAERAARKAKAHLQEVSLLERTVRKSPKSSGYLAKSIIRHHPIERLMLPVGAAASAYVAFGGTKEKRFQRFRNATIGLVGGSVIAGIAGSARGKGTTFVGGGLHLQTL